MSILWQTNDIVVIAQAFIQSSLAFENVSSVLQQSLQMLGYLNGINLKVMRTGQVNELFYIQLLPLYPLTGAPYLTHMCYNQGRGSIIYFSQEADLNNSFKIAAGSFPTVLSKQIVNGTSMPLVRNTIVRRLGIDPATQFSTVDLASASSLLTSSPVGMIISDIVLPGQVGVILEQGVSPPVNTIGTYPGGPIWLSDLPGGFQLTSGTVGVILGTVISVGILGNFYLGGGGVFPTLFQ